MIVYLAKFVLCSGILFLFYSLVLKHQKLFKFNRYYLLAILIFALIIPITIVNTQFVDLPVINEPITELGEFASIVQESQYSNSSNIAHINASRLISLTDVLIGIYLTTSLFLLIRFAKNLLSIWKLNKEESTIQAEGIKIVLRSDISTSFSFLNRMFTNKERFLQGNLSIEVIEHEKLHIKQKHSLDIIYIELSQCIFWFNPFIHFIKKAVKLNHEFLADAHVINTVSSTYNYQKILLDYSNRHVLKSPAFVSNLNYGFTKKRLKMMTKNTSRFKSASMKVAAFITICSTFWVLGGTKTVAQQIKQEVPGNSLSKEVTKSTTHKPIDSKTPSLSKEIFKSNGEKIFGLRPNNKVRFKSKSGELVTKLVSELTESETKSLYHPETKAEWYRIPPPVRKVTQDQLDDFLSSTKYGIWLNNKRIDNSLLANYKPEDIYHFDKSVLRKGAKNYGKHTFQVNIVTVEYAKTKPFYSAGWVSFHKQWEYFIQLPKVKGAAYDYSRKWPTKNNSKVRYTDKTGQLIENSFGEIDKQELEHPDRSPEIFIPAISKMNLSQENFDAYLDSKKYGVWIDDRKINNSELSQFSPSDFYHLRQFKLTDQSSAERGYSYHVIFYTEKNFKKRPESKGRWVPLKLKLMAI